MTDQQLQAEIDRQNAAFWDELCGSSLARSIGVTEPTREGLARFDSAYLELYPYLEEYVPSAGFRGAKLLEIGLGFGTLSQVLAEAGADYHGLDIAEGPVRIVGERLRRLGQDADGRVLVASTLDLPFGDETFAYVYSIGCLHHTGDLPRAVAEVCRVLRPGGTAVVMLYNRHSYRRLIQLPLVRVKEMGRREARLQPYAEQVRAAYDTNEAGAAAPHTEYVSRHDVRRLFDEFADVRIDGRNFDALIWFRGRLVLTRERMLASPVPRLLGLDLYVTAVK